jgi:hypothetical protein
VDFGSCDGLFAFLEGEMSDKNATMSSKSEDTRQFRLEIIRLAKRSASDQAWLKCPFALAFRVWGKRGCWTKAAPFCET